MINLNKKLPIEPSGLLRVSLGLFSQDDRPQFHAHYFNVRPEGAMNLQVMRLEVEPAYYYLVCIIQSFAYTKATVVLHTGACARCTYGEPRVELI
jgi:hypothetical protein